jgi:hypothetical protein
MANLIADELVNHTRSFISRNGTLTYGFAKGSYSPVYRDLMKGIIAEVDDRLTGISFKRIKPASGADLVINHGELPAGSSGAAVWDDNGWEIRLPERGFSTTVFRHELGHVLGLGHVPMGTNSLMQPGMNGVYDFTKKDWKALESIWGKGELLMGDAQPKGKRSKGMLVFYDKTQR